MGEENGLDKAINHTDETRCHLLISRLDAIIWEADPNNLQFSFVNERAKSILGYPIEQWLREPNFWVDHIHADDRDQALIFCRTAIKEGKDHTFEYRAIAADGRTVWLRDIVKVITDTKGKAQRILGIMIDISEHRQMADALRDSEMRFHAAFDRAAIGQALTDKDGNFMQVNDAYCKITGYTEHELYSKSVESITHPEDYPTCKAYIRELLAGNRDSFIIEKRYITKDGKAIWIRNSTAAIKDRDGNVSNLIALSEDITDRKKAELCLSESEEKYRDIFEESKDVIFVSTPDGRFTDINPAGLELLGYSSLEHLMRIDIAKDLYIDAHERKVFQQEIDQRGYVKDFEVKLKTVSGRPITVRITATALRNGQGQIISYRGIMRDVTLEKTLEQQILQAQKMEAVGQLAGGIAHDFNNILSAIIGYGHLALMQTPQDNPIKPYIEQILDSSEKAAALTQNLLAFSRQQIMNPQPAKIDEIIRNVAPVLKRLIREDIELKLELSAGDSTVFVDHLQIEQVLMNLATNARDAMPDGGILKIGTQQIDIDKSYIEVHGYGDVGRYIIISVQDTGSGMDEITKRRIFEPFFTTKELGKGTGLGLAMVYGVVKQNKGFINVYSELGKGTTFRIYLPEVAVSIEQRKDIEIVSAYHGTETILIVEDDAVLRDLTSTVLKKHGYIVIAAANGIDALSLFRENGAAINLLITDVVLPQKSGIEVFEEIREIRPDMKALFLSGYSKDIAQIKGVLDTSFNFLQKPISPNILLKKVRDILDH